MVWKLATLDATDWSSSGFASEVLWVGTNSDPTHEYPNVWVEVGVTNGWEGQDVYTYYAVMGNDDYGEYAEGRITSITPQVGTTHTFSGYSIPGPSLYIVSVDTTTITFSPHAPNTMWVQGGLESTCDNSRVDNTYVSSVKYRRKSDAVWRNATQGTLGKIPANGVGVVAWCTSPTKFRYSLHSQIPLGCS